MKNLNFVAGITRRFVSAKRLIRYFSNSSKLVEHRAQSPVREVKMLAVWPSIAEGFPTASSRVYMQYKLSSTCEEFKFRGWYNAAFRLGQETHQILFEFQIEGQTANILTSRTGLWARCSTSLLEFEKYLMSLLAETKRRVIPATKFKFFTSTWQFLFSTRFVSPKMTPSPERFP